MSLSTCMHIPPFLRFPIIPGPCPPAPFHPWILSLFHPFTLSPKMQKPCKNAGKMLFFISPWVPGCSLMAPKPCKNAYQKIRRALKFRVRSKAEGLQLKENPGPLPLPGKTRHSHKRLSKNNLKIALKYQLDSGTACHRLQHISIESHKYVQNIQNMIDPRTR